MKKLTPYLFFFFAAQIAMGQGKLTDEMKATEEELYASTKQLNQFIRRFNGEEDVRGNRIYSEDKKYRDKDLRKKYISRLFDLESGFTDKKTIGAFIEDVVDDMSPSFLDFHSDNWFAEASVLFEIEGKNEPALLFLHIQPQGLGYEWVIDGVAMDYFQLMFNKDSTIAKPFLHPMSHELGFMNLRKAFQNNQNPESYTPDSFHPDYLSLFLYELKKGNLKFTTVNSVRFHFFNLDNWYFEVSNYNRPGFNSGWLISNLVPLQNESDKQQLRDFIYDKL